jgi:hypothetical protein
MPKLTFEQKKIFYEFWNRFICEFSSPFCFEQDIKHIPFGVLENTSFFSSIDEYMLKKLIKVYKMSINNQWVSLELTSYGKRVLKEFEVEKLIS